MHLPARETSFAAHIKCSTCETDIPLQQVAEHVCSKVTTSPLVEEPAQIQPFTDSSASTEPTAARPSRPFVPKIDPFAPSKPGLYIDYTSKSTGAGPAAASPVSSGRRSPFLQPPRKGSAPTQRRPSSPELLSQDCAFPPFPTSKTRKKEIARTAQERTPDSRSSENSRKRSASIRTSRSRLRHDTGESTRPSTANSSRQASISSRAGSRKGSLDTVPPLPPREPTISQSAPDPGLLAQPSQLGGLLSPSREASPATNTSADGRISFPELTTTASNLTDVSTSSAMIRESGCVGLSPSPTLKDPHASEPSYRAERPSLIVNPPSAILDESFIVKPQLSPSIPPTPQTTSSTLARTLTSLFGRKRGQTISSKKGTSKTPPTDGPRFMALSPDPDPQDAPRLSHSAHSSIDTDTPTDPLVHGTQEGPRCSVETIPVNRQYTEIIEDQIKPTESIPARLDAEESHDIQRDTLQMEEDLEKRLAAMTGVPHLSVIEEHSETIKRASIDSASSYGSVGFSNSSTSSRSFRGFDSHSQVSSISTARTISSNEDAFLTNMAKIRNPDAMPDSPTDPYLQFGRLTPVADNLSPAAAGSEVELGLQHGQLSTVHEALPAPEEEKREPIAPVSAPEPSSPGSDLAKFDFPQPPQVTPPVPLTPESELDLGDFLLSVRQRRPSTPGAIRGTCRDCSKPILSGQKAVSSKDGRLTGKYHKECFTCVTCKEPFATADFYVHHDHPYCAHHYHELNGTLCEGCGNGIEGHYLETSNVSGNGTKKFHPHCLKCDTCHIQLGEDYFELNGRVYCEKDAFRVISGPRSPYGTAPSRPSPLNREYISSGQPGQVLTAGKFPERRLTRLMTTA